MAMHTPFTLGLTCMESCNSFGQIHIASELSRVLDHHLVQVHRIVKSLHRWELRLGHLGNANRAAELDFGNRNACLAQFI